MKQTQKEKDQRELTYLESQHAALYRDIATVEDRIREVKNRLQVKPIVPFLSSRSISDYEEYQYRTWPPSITDEVRDSIKSRTL